MHIQSDPLYLPEREQIHTHVVSGKISLEAVVGEWAWKDAIFFS